MNASLLTDSSLERRALPWATQMKKSEAEKAIRHLCHEWAKEQGIAIPPVDQPSFAEFRAWLGVKGHSHYLTFRSSLSPIYDAEIWFDQEFKKTSRN